MDEWEYSFIQKQILQLTGVDLRSYKAPQMQRRLEAYLKRSGYTDWPRFFRVVHKSPEEREKLKTYLTINVSSFFRDPHKYETLKQKIIPQLLAERDVLRVWSAGCSRGQEAYSIAMLLSELCTPQQSFRISATDIDKDALAWAKAGGPYSADDVQHVSSYLRLQYFEIKNGSFWIKKPLQQNILFRPQNLLTDPMYGLFDLVVCRNVVIYFEVQAKLNIYQKFYKALRPGGVLFVGGTEIVPKAKELGFELADLSFYRRPKPESRFKFTKPHS